MSTATKRPRLDAETIDFRRRVFEIAAELVEEAGVADVDEVDPRDVAARYREATGDASSRTRPVRIALLLADPARYSPFVDEVAIERALAFDWRVIERLSDLEWQTVTGRLAAMPDPWEMESVNRASRPGVSGDGWSLGDLVIEDEEPPARSPRRLRFEEGPESIRQRLLAAVALARQEREGAAA